jgi:hypothetical protein
MTTFFSEELRDRIVRYFQKHHQRTVTTEEADIYLTAFSRFYLSLSKVGATERFFEVIKLPPASRASHSLGN